MLLESGGINDGSINSKEMTELRERLRISESLMSEMTKSREEKLRETERLHQVRNECMDGLMYKCMYDVIRLDKRL